METVGADLVQLEKRCNDLAAENAELKAQLQRFDQLHDADRYIEDPWAQVLRERARWAVTVRISEVLNFLQVPLYSRTLSHATRLHNILIVLGYVPSLPEGATEVLYEKATH